MTAPIHAPQIHGIDDIRALEARPYAEFMPHASVPAALAASAARWPQQVALRFIVDADLATPPQDTTYADLLAAVHHAGHLFTALAAPERPRVALLLPAIPQAHVALWAAESVGLACPLNYLLQPDHLVHLVQSAGCNVLVALAPGQGLDLAERVAALQAQCPALRHVLWVGPGLAADTDFDALCAAQPADAPAAAQAAQPDDMVALFHTGGTTGAPKLAQHTHRNQLHSARGAALMYGTTPEDRIVNGLPMFHVAGSLVFGLSTLLAGGTIVLPTLLGMRNADYMRRYWAFAARERATLVTATPTGIATLMAAPREGLDLSSVRALLTGGAPLPTGLADAFERDFGIPVRNTLGMTECAGVISIEPVAAPRVAGSCGLRLPYLTVAFDAHEATRRDGVLRLRGPNVSPGYTEAARNAGMFEDGWLVSGDLARIDDNERLFVTGRAKDLIIRNSHNIDPQVIEEALMRHPDVAMAAAVGEPDAYAGELPVAFVVLHPGSTADAGAILRFIEPLIAERPAFPKRLEVLPALPQTAVGKVYKPALRLRAIEQALARQLEAAGLSAAVTVQGEERDGRLAVRFTAEAEHQAALEPLMQPYALPWRRVAAIEFWFDVISPYAWLASRHIDALAARHGRAVRWRPMLLGVSVMKVMGLRPLMETPLKRDYVLRDLRRGAREAGLTIARDLEAAPMSPLPAARALAWLDAHARDFAGPVAQAVMARYWLDAAAMDDAAALRAVMAAVGVPAAQIDAALAPEPGSALLRESVNAGLAAGVFGSPTLRIDGEPFWGHDRLDEAERWLMAGGW